MEKQSQQPSFKYELSSIHPVNGRQGICVEGDYYWVSGSTTLTKYDQNWNVIQENTEPFKGYEKEVNHIGDIDVYENEPLPMDSGLRGLDNVILMPHRGGPTTDVREWVTIELAQDVKKFFDGDTNLKHQISLEYASRMTDETKFKKQLGG